MPSETRDRLLRAAVKLFHTQGYTATSVTEIEDEAGVTRGSFTNHFKTKEELGLAAADERKKELQQHLNAIELHPSADDRIIASLQIFAAHADEFAEFGDPIIKIANATSDDSRAVASAYADVYVDYLTWLEKQCVLVGPYKQARGKAVEIARELFGAAVLCKLLKDERQMKSAVSELENYVRPAMMSR